MDDLNEEIAKIRFACGTVLSYDWVSLPLVYTQVVTLAVYPLISITHKQSFSSSLLKHNTSQLILRRNEIFLLYQTSKIVISENTEGFLGTLTSAQPYLEDNGWILSKKLKGTQRMWTIISLFLRYLKI